MQLKLDRCGLPVEEEEAIDGKAASYLITCDHDNECHDREEGIAKDLVRSFGDIARAATRVQPYKYPGASYTVYCTTVVQQ